MPQDYQPDATQQAALAALKNVVAARDWSDQADVLEPHLSDWRGLFKGQAQLLLRPRSTAEVSAILKICHDARLPVVPQGGNTGQCGGQTPSDTGNAVILSLAHMNQVRAIDNDNFTMTAEAGCILSDLQDTAAAADRYFPLSLAAEGSCMLGGNLSTNAGGTNVLKYGNARDLVLGLEIVLPDGEVIDGLRGLRKDNTGYDLKQLFLGAEGTLGVITAAVLKLYPRPRDIRTAYCAIRDVAASVELLARARDASGDRVETFELIPRALVDLVLQTIPDCQDPMPSNHDQHVLLELISSQPDDPGLDRMMEDILGQAMEDGLVHDAVICQNESQRQNLWKIRENAAEAQKVEGASIKHDISVPVSRIAEFYGRAHAAALAIEPNLRLIGFGHVGDGNLHYNMQRPMGGDNDAFLAKKTEINRAVHDVVVEMDGSISAEHGIGRLKRDELAHYKSPIELAVMRKLKAAIDPHGIMNPGVLL